MPWRRLGDDGSVDVNIEILRGGHFVSSVVNGVGSTRCFGGCASGGVVEREVRITSHAVKPQDAADVGCSVLGACPGPLVLSKHSQTGIGWNGSFDWSLIREFRA